MATLLQLLQQAIDLSAGEVGPAAAATLQIPQQRHKTHGQGGCHGSQGYQPLPAAVAQQFELALAVKPHDPELPAVIEPGPLVCHRTQPAGGGGLNRC